MTRRNISKSVEIAYSLTIYVEIDYNTIYYAKRKYILIPIIILRSNYYPYLISPSMFRFGTRDADIIQPCSSDQKRAAFFGKQKNNE